MTGEFNDPIPGNILELAQALIGGDAASASMLAKRIDGEALFRQRLTLFSSVKRSPRAPSPPGVARSPRSSIAEAVKLRVFRRDRFTCRLCLRPTLYLPALQAISRALPAEMPYQPSWAFGTTHPIYWTHSTSLEHLTPLARLGLDDARNFVTSCYACNSARGDCLLEEIGWRLHDAEEALDWDGLSGLLDALVAKYPSAITTGRAPRKVVEAVRESGTAIPLATSWIDATALSVGNLVRVAAEGRTQRRLHRIEAVSAGRATLREMWREEGRWVESRMQRSLQLEGRIEIVAFEAPAPAWK